MVTEYLEENKMDIGTVFRLKFTDLDGVHVAKCRVSNYGYSGRDPIYYELQILESDSKKYNVGALFILGFDFNDRENGLLFYPNVSGHGSYSEQHYKSKINII